jgi:essential nuclear protein 1
MPKTDKSSRNKSSRNNPVSNRQTLEDEIKQKQITGTLKPIQSQKKPAKSSNNNVGDDEDDEELDAQANQLISNRLSKKILSAAHSQQAEELDSAGENSDMADDIELKAESRRSNTKVVIRGTNSNPNKPTRAKRGAESDSENDEEEFLPGEEELEELELGEEDEKSLAMFMPESNKQKKTLADMIFEKLNQANAAIGLNQANSGGNIEPNANEQKLDSRITTVYTDVGNYLKHFTSGKIPKAFKIIPTLRNWEQILLLTQPETWTVQAVSAATRLFASNLNPKMAQRFYNTILLPRVRFDIEAHKKLNYHLYIACKRAIYKPAAFFKGLLLPLAAESCTTREAVIFSSILAKCSIPADHSAVALLKLAELNIEEYSGTTTLLIKTLLNKKYSLAYRVIDTIMKFFAGFLQDQRHMPLIWHQCLLVFVQRYKSELSEQQRHTIKALCKKQIHQQITPDIRRELQAAAANEALVNSGAMIDTGNMTILQLQQLHKQMEKQHKAVKQQKNSNSGDMDL